MNYFYTTTKCRKISKSLFSTLFYFLMLIWNSNYLFYSCLNCLSIKILNKRFKHIEKMGDNHWAELYSLSNQKKRTPEEKKITNGKTLKHLLVIFSTPMILDFPTKLKHHFPNNNVIHFWQHKRMLLRHKKCISLM